MNIVEHSVKQSYYEVDLRQYTKKFVREFIETYRSLPALWKIRTKEYTDKIAKAQAYEKLAAKLKEVDPNADRDTVKRKINSMRTTFRKEWRKVQSSRRHGDFGESVYKPSLWYYELLLFLSEQHNPPPALIPATVPAEQHPHIEVEPVCKQEVVDLDDDDEDFFDDSSLTQGNDETQPEQTQREPWTPVQKPTPPQVPPPQMEIAEESLKQTTPGFSGNADDEFDCIAKTWAIKLKRMSSLQKLFAERLVNDVLFEGELGTLSRSSVLKVDPKSD